MRKLMTLTGLIALFAVPAMAEITGPGPLGDDANDALNVTATIGSFVYLDATDPDIIFPAAAVDPEAEDWQYSSGTETVFTPTNVAGDGVASAKIRSNRRLLMAYSNGSNLTGAAFGVVLPTEFQTTWTGRWMLPIDAEDGHADDYPVVVGGVDVSPWANAGVDADTGYFGIERAMSDATVAQIWTRARIFRSGLLDSMDVYTQDPPAQVTIQYAEADGSLP